MLGTNWDVTNEVTREEILRAKLENESNLLQQALAGQKAKTDFMAVMSHEIRNPMNGVLGFAELLSHSDDLTLSDRELCQTIVSSGETLLRILDDLLDFSRIEGGRLKIEKKNFSLRELVRAVEFHFRRQMQEKALDFQVSLDDELPETMVGDSGRIRQVLLNLLGNALKFTEHGTVRLDVRSSFESAKVKILEFTISDSGPGIPSKMAEAVFAPFTQADSSISRRYGGTGLGLSISSKLADLMGGEIRIGDSQLEGVTFIFRVPFDSSEQPQNSRSDTPVLPLRVDSSFAFSHPLSILVVEDDKVNLKLIAGLLRKLGYAPLSASNGREAVALYAQESPDCIFMDLQMPEMDGIEATSSIRAFEALHSISPVFISALTANIVPEHQLRCFDAGMNAYLNKPIKSESIMNTLVAAENFRFLAPW